MDYEKEIVERLTRIEAGQENLIRTIQTMNKSIEKMNTTLFEHEKRISHVEYDLKDHIKDYSADRAKTLWRYGLIIPLLVSGAVALVDIVMRFVGY